MTFSQYPGYRDSGVEWIGEVPTNWKTLPLLAVASERAESNIGMKEDNLLSLSYGKNVGKDIQSNDGLLPESFETYQIVHRHDIILRLTDLQNDKRSLRTGIVLDNRGIITSAYIALKPYGINPIYLACLLHAYDLTKVFYSMGGGLRQSMRHSDIKWMPIIVPSANEQVTIVSVLQYELHKIDALIAEQEKLIILLMEKRQAVISHAVTKGLNSDAPMKDSGVEWLGMVPEHWEVRRLRFMCILNPGKSEINRESDIDVSFVPMEAVDTTGGINAYEKSLMDVYDGYTYFRENDILVAKITPCFENGKGALAIGLINGIGFGTTEFHVLRVKNRFLPKYLYFITVSNLFRRQGEASMIGAAGQKRVPEEYFRNYPCTVPPHDEQTAIVEYIESVTKDIDVIIIESERQIKLLKERRQTLISAAVTGKIDVRGLTPTETA